MELKRIIYAKNKIQGPICKKTGVPWGFLAEPLTGGEVVGEIRRVQGPRSRKEASVMLLESRRGFCAAPMGLRCGGAA